ncbi:ROK family transcriptional regulator [Yinghuangia seranimata]|uniref:ROK family transcriptional regulator n=1 Tax=Yinghuangia seranimata TaxID=408067 RepID=UPI00248D1977|nr:ROK family transcriptional regulator [Yinghuangia seranimata]MDI2129822.1 ROK family transcriptional regulator [Yinghuangia seranimata]
MSGDRAGRPSLLRAINDRAALDLLLRHGPLSRGRIGQLTGLSKPTASQLLARLEAAGLVRAVGTAGGGPGPAAQLYELNPAAAHVAGLDVTPARIDVAVADLSGHVVAEYRLPTPRRAPVNVAARLREAVAAATASAGLAPADLTHVVIGMPGAFDPATGRFRYARHLPGWHAPGVLDEVRTALGTTVDVENDVNLVALAEQREGAAKDPGDFVLLWVDEGIGSALVLGGRLHRGATGGAGEVGYMPLPGAPVIRDIGRSNTGGFQQLAGAPAVLALAKTHGISARTAAGAVAQAVAAEPQHSPGGAGFLDELATRLAVGLASIVAVLDPALVVLSGAVPLTGGAPLLARVTDELHGLAIPRPRLVLGEVRGNPVRTGAVHAALDVARDSVFTTA